MRPPSSQTLFRTLSCTLLLAAWSFVYSAHSAAGQKSINGNGRIIEQIRPLNSFSAVSLDFVADVLIVNGETPSFQIAADENVLPHIGTRVRSGTLYITQDRWIEPSQRVRIRIGAPFTSKLATSGYSDVVVEGLSGPRMQVDVEVGDATLFGATDRLQVRTRKGDIDARGLDTPYADVSIKSRGTVRLGTTEQLIVDVEGDGEVVYDGAPEITHSNNSETSSIISSEAYEEPVSVEVQYVAFTLVNNSRRRISLRVEGPRAKSFGYGFNLIPFGRRKENWPVGTRVYRENRLSGDQLLLTIRPDMSGNKVDLFSDR